MDDSLGREIQDHLASYLGGTVAFDAFQDWLIDVLWRVDHPGDAGAAPLAYHVENRVAEYTGDHITEDQLKEALRADLHADFPAIAAQVLAPSAS